MTPDGVRRARFVTQGLADPSNVDPTKADPTKADPTKGRVPGWIRTLGGAEAYLGLSARLPGTTVDGVHGWIAAGAWRVVPAVRGCIYLVPAADVPLALGVAAALGGKRTAKDQATAGVTDDDVARAADAVWAALGAGPGTTLGLKKRVDAGKALTFALRRLELEGRVWRRPEGCRLDHERYEWLRVDAPAPVPPLDAAALARRWTAWAGPAEAADFRAWSGLGARDAKGLPAPEGVELATTPSRTVLLPGLDAFYGSYAEPTGVDDDLADVAVTWFSSAGQGPLGGSNQPLERTVVRDGSVVGLWGWDPDARRVELAPLRGGVEVTAGELERVTTVLEALGHGRSSVLDGDDDLRARLRLVRAAARR